MPTIEVRCAVGSDDGWSRSDGYWRPADMFMYVGKTAGGTGDGWLRFPGCVIPNGATITVAYFRQYSETHAKTLTRIYAEDQPDPSAPANRADHIGRTRTTNYTTWDIPLPGDPTAEWRNSPSIVDVIQELVDSYDYSGGAAIQILHDNDATVTNVNIISRTIEWSGTGVYAAYLYITYEEAVAPTVTTPPATSVEATTATGNGNITDIGSENCDKRGIVYGLTSQGDPGDVAPGASGYDDFEEETDSFGTGAFTRSLTGLSTGRTYYARAYAHNSGGYAYGAEVSFLTKPAAPTNVAATDGDHSDKVVITWTKSTGATGYQVYRDGTPLGWLGDVATFDDTGAGAPSITPGDSVASDGGYEESVSLTLSGTGTNNGTTHTYKVRARNATGESADSGTNTGYRAPGALTYQWERSAADSDADYSDISGATTAIYDDTGAPPYPGGRYYKCRLNATGATEQTSSPDRGHRGNIDGIFGELLDELPDVMGAQTREIRWASPYAVFTDYGYLNIMDCSDPSNLVARDREASIYPGAGEGALLVEHPLIYRGQSEWPTVYFDIWDMTDPDNLVLRDRVEVSSEYWSFMSDLAKSGNYCYLSGNKYDGRYEHITIMNVSNPDIIIEESVFDGGANLALTPTGLAVDATGNYLFVTCRSLFTVLDISTKNAPVYSNKITITETALGPGRIRLTADGYAYATRISPNSIDIIDVRDPTSVSLVGTFTDNNFLRRCRSIQIIGDYLFGFNYFAHPIDGKYYVSVWDITTRASPSLADRICMDDIGLWRIGAFLAVEGSTTLYVGKRTTSTAESFASIGFPAAPAGFGRSPVDVLVKNALI